MGNDPQNLRKKKRLLVAGLGVATVSFMSLQGGCEDPDDGQMTNVANLLTPPVDTFHDPSLARDAALDAATDALVGSGNLLPPFTQDASSRDAAGDAIVTSGNLLPPPDASLRDAAGDAIVTSGNLLPPPDAATDAAAGKDARIDTGLPTSGNLVPLPPRESR